MMVNMAESEGKRFYEPVVFWIGGETNETV